jgi:hypothetical protein
MSPVRLGERESSPSTPEPVPNRTEPAAATRDLTHTQCSPDRDNPHQVSRRVSAALKRVCIPSFRACNRWHMIAATVRRHCFFE